MFIVPATLDPAVLVVPAVMVAVVATLGWRRDDASGHEYGDAQKKTAHYHTFPVFHGLSPDDGSNLKGVLWRFHQQDFARLALLYCAKLHPQLVGIRTGL